MRRYTQLVLVAVAFNEILSPTTYDAVRCCSQSRAAALTIGNQSWPTTSANGEMSLQAHDIAIISTMKTVRIQPVHC
jgi:hypothetical protein